MDCVAGRDYMCFVDHFTHSFLLTGRYSIDKKKELQAEALTAVVDEDLCSGCGMCVSICAFGAIEIDKEKDGTQHAKINEALCKGCGACVGTCPSGAMQQRGYKDKQLIPMVDETI